MDVLRDPSPEQVRQAVRECAEDVASVRERSVILRAIVRRTRSLFGTDMAYLSINDLRAGQTHIEFSEGVQTSEYRNIRMPLGTGVLGAVAAGNRPVQTSAYLTDPGMNHLAEIDEIVRGEGVSAILGVPIRLGGRVVAALMVAQRAPTQFTDATVAAMTDMAAQAGVAFEQIRLGRELAAARAELSATESSTQHQSTLESLLHLDDRLMAALISATGLPGLVDVVVEASGVPLGVYDPSGDLLAGTPTIHPPLLRSPELRSMIAVSQRAQGAVTIESTDPPLLLMAAAAGDEHVATLIAPESPSGRTILSRGSVFVTTLRLFERNLLEADHRAQTELIEDLLAARDRDYPNLVARLESHGITEDSAMAVHVCDTRERLRDNTVMAGVRAALSGYPAVISMHAGHVCVIAAAQDLQSPSRAGGLIHDLLLKRGIRALVGTATASNIAEIAHAHHEAAAVIDALSALGRTHAAADTLDLGVAGTIAGVRDAGWVEQLISRKLSPLQDYDAEHDTQLCLTAWHYLENGGRLTPIAESLHVHRNTVRQRADRIDALIGSSWRLPPESIDMHFTLRLWRLRSTMQSLRD
ncbi:helix-turn-helix domain-containing protein [Nocardia salmonicida]|uniref:helix-turn-helix domain-containing protein n=1 Tax=Nocardia salmonicida TaxID=53431 RepID=UPI0033F66328